MITKQNNYGGLMSGKVTYEYTMNFMVDGIKIPYAKTKIETFDRLTTHFNDESNLVNFLNTLSLANGKIDGVIIDHPVTFEEEFGKKKTIIAKEPLVFKPRRALVNNESLDVKILVNKIIDNYEKLRLFNINKLDNDFLKRRIKSLLSTTFEKDYIFKAAKLKDLINKSYKTVRDLAIWFDNEYTNNNRMFLQPVIEEFDMIEMMECLSEMQLISKKVPKKKKVVKEPLYKEALTEPYRYDNGDDYYDSYVEELLAREDYDMIAQTYSNDDPRIRGIFDGTREYDSYEEETNIGGKSR